MSTMKICRFPSKGGKLEFADVPVPNPGPNQVRIKVHSCGVCHSDCFTQYGGMGNSFPRAPGHEVAGVVDALGEGVKGFKKGDRVGLGWFGGCCGECANCVAGDWVHCEKGQVAGISYDGGYAEYTVAPAIALARIPDEVTFEEASPLMCAGVTVYNSMRNMGVLPGEVVAIQGVGGLGHLAVQYAHKMGFKVVAISTNADKEALAKKLGAHHYINTGTSDVVEELKKLGGAKLIVTTASDAKAISPLAKALKVRGKLLILSVTQDPVAINPLDLISSKGSVVGWASGDSRDSEATMKFSALTGVKSQNEVMPFSQAPEAYERAMANKARFRVVLKMD